jgi:hypothetical protein
MQTNPAAQDARTRLGATAMLAIQMYGLTAAVRALLATHPQPEKARAVFDQLLGQMLAHPGFLVDQDQGIVLRDFAATLFQPSVQL